jgi:hypothetical protein
VTCLQHAVLLLGFEYGEVSTVTLEKTAGEIPCKISGVIISTGKLKCRFATCCLFWPETWPGESYLLVI